MTDVVDTRHMLRRFYLGAVSANCIVAAIEHGGLGYSVDVHEISRADGEWHSRRTGIACSRPERKEELIQITNKP